MYRNPILLCDYSDPDVIRAGNLYFMVASSFNFTPGLPILASKDLVHWKLVNYAVENIPVARFAYPQNAQGIWAPSFSYHNGKYYIVVGMPDEGLYITEADDILGHWSPLKQIYSSKGYIDPYLFWDDDGSAWVIHAYAKSRCGFNSRLGLLKFDTEYYDDQYYKSDYEEYERDFYPDDEVLEVVEFDISGIKTMVKEFSFLCKGLRFVITEPGGATEEYISHNGLADYMEYLCKGQEMLIPPLYFDVHEDKFQLEVAIGYTKAYSSITKLYTNNIPQEKGTHYTGFKTAWTSNLNAFARENKWLKEKETNLTGSDYDEGMVLILNFKMIDPVFKGQNKEELSSSEGRTYTQKLTTMALKELLPSRIKDIKIIIEKALDARKAREAAKKAKEAIRGAEPKKKKAFLNLPTKLVDCWSKDRSKCELYIAEGDSAATGLVEARNSETQAVFPIRGKIISARKSTSEKLLANQEVVNIIKALGLEFDAKTVKLVYDPKKLRYHSIMMAADGDPDGEAIKNLLLTLFWELCPELIINGHVYATIPPLFRVTDSKNNYIYLRNNAALEEYKAQNLGKKFVINRNKG